MKNNYHVLASFLVILICIFIACVPEATIPAPTESIKIDFSANPCEGQAPQQVNFTAITNNDIDSYYWDFGDGKNSSEKNPVHIYDNAGLYTVILVVDGVNGIGVEKKVDYIAVTKTADDPVNECIDWRDAGLYIGEIKTVAGVIKDAYYASNINSRPTFLNFNLPYKGYFTCVIWGSDRAKFVNMFHAAPESYLLKKHVEVTGLIEEYPEGSGVPEMILKEPSQVAIVEVSE